MAQAQQQYEAMFLFGPSAANDLEGALNVARQMIERHEGQILVLKKWDERRLAYEIAGQKRGTYIIAYFTAPGSAVGAIERDVSLNDQVLRVLVLRADHLSQQEMEAVEPQPIERPAERREERPGRPEPRQEERRAAEQPQAEAVGTAE